MKTTWRQELTWATYWWGCNKVENLAQLSVPALILVFLFCTMIYTVATICTVWCTYADVGQNNLACWFSCYIATQAHTTMFIHVYSQVYFWDVTELSMDDAHVVYVTVVLDSCVVRCSLCSARRWRGGVVNWCTCFSYVHVLPSYSLLASSPPNHICTENAYVLLPNVISCLGGVYDTIDLCPC